MLKRAIHSVLCQDYKDFELIVIVDACHDETLSVLDDFKAENITIIKSDINLGGAEARNLGIRLAKGEYIAFLDDDDEWLQCKLSKQIRLLKQHEDIVLVTTDFIQSDNSTRHIVKITDRLTLNDLYYENFIGSFSFCLVRAKELKELQINKKLTACQDWDLWIKLLASSGQKACNLGEPLVIYHTDHNERISSNLENIYMSRILFLRSHWENMSKEQKYFQLFDLIKMKRSLQYNDIGYIYRIKMYLKALKFYYKSGYNQGIYNYSLLFTKLLNYS